MEIELMARRPTENPGTEPALSRNRRGKSGGQEPALPGAMSPMEFLRGITPSSWSREQRLAAVPAVIRTLRGPDPEVRAEAVRTLRVLDCSDRDVAEALLQAGFDEDAEVWGEALYALGTTLRGRACTDAFRIVYGRLAGIVTTVIEIPHRTDPYRVLEVLNRRETIPNHVAALSHPNWFVRLVASNFLRDIRENALDPLPEIAIAVDGLSEQLTDPDAHRRECAVEAIGDLGTTEQILSLVRMLDDPSREVRDATADAFGCAGAKASGAIPALRDRLIAAGEQNWVRPLASALAHITHPDAIPALTFMLTHADATVRYHGAHGLGKVGLDARSDLGNYPADCFAEAVPALIRALGDGTIRVRRAALDALATIGEPDAATRAAVASLRNDPAPSVRQSAAKFCRRWSIES